MGEEHYHLHRFQLDAIFIGILGILCGAIIVVIFHCLSSGLCGRVPSLGPPSRLQIARRSREVFVPNSSASSSSAITVYKGSYVEDKETMCAVCLNEFSGGEEVRVLPECAHTFHVQCIDMWLFSHRNCPLCRADALPPPPHVVVSLPDSGGVPPSELHRLPDFGG